jgi:hypothetical protein
MKYTPIECLVVQYDLLGWTYGCTDGNLRIAINERQAFYLIGAINRAAAICAMPGNLWRVDNAEQARRDEAYEVD